MGFSKIFRLWVIYPQKPQNWKGLNRQLYSDVPTVHRTHCRHMLFTPRCNARASEFHRTGQLLCTTYGFGSRGHQISQIFAFFPVFFHTKRLKVLFVRGIQPRGYITQCFRLFHVVVEGQQGAPFASGVFLWHLVGELEIPKLAQISPIGNACIYTQCYYTAHLVSKKRLKTRYSVQGCAFLGMTTMFPQSMGVKPQNETLGSWTGLSSVHDKQFEHL